MVVRTNSSFGAGVLIAAKKDGTLRLYIDYRHFMALRSEVSENWEEFLKSLKVAHPYIHTT